MDSLTITGGVLIMKKLAASILLTMGMGSIFSSADALNTFYCPQTLMCSGGNCTPSVTPIPPSVFTTPTPAFPIPDDTYTFFAARGEQANSLDFSTARSMVFCYYQNSANNQVTGFVFQAKPLVNDQIFYPDATDSIWNFSAGGFVCTNATSSNCKFYCQSTTPSHCTVS